MPNAYGKKIDKTYLSVDMAEKRGFIHRDYIAHCLRWSHVVKYLQQKSRYKTARILDIGCGKEIPLLKLLYSSKMFPQYYIGVDYGPLVLLDSLKHYQESGRVQLFPNTDIENFNVIEPPSIITMFEALEHVERDRGVEILCQILNDFMDEDTVFFMSTPCYDGVNKAGNHVYEWTYLELHAELKSIGFKIKNAWGTFASMKDYKGYLEGNDYDYRDVFYKLSEYYDVNLVSCIFAPLFPAQSRNCLWQLTK